MLQFLSNDAIETKAREAAVLLVDILSALPDRDLMVTFMAVLLIAHHEAADFLVTVERASERRAVCEFVRNPDRMAVFFPVDDEPGFARGCAELADDIAKGAHRA